jgi:hypothetical protein
MVFRNLRRVSSGREGRAVPLGIEVKRFGRASSREGCTESYDGDRGTRKAYTLDCPAVSMKFWSRTQFFEKA